MAETRFIDTGEGHQVAYSVHGNIDGFPILVFHGGPGGSAKIKHAQRFDLMKYRVILFDQRGCGLSTPLGKIENNDTKSLLADAERIRNELGIEKWFVSGSSWGSTLAILYALVYPDRVRGLLLSAVFFADRDTVSWSLEQSSGAMRLMPEVREKVMRGLNEFGITIGDPWQALHNTLENVQGDALRRLVALILGWESSLMSIDGEIGFKSPELVTDSDISYARIFVHYAKQRFFIPEGYILQQVPKLNSLSGVVVHGRYDILCPLDKVYGMCSQLHDWSLIVAPRSGHVFTSEGEVIRELAFDRFLSENLQRNTL